MSVYMDDIAEIRKGIRNCTKVEKEKKMRYGVEKAKYMMVKPEKEREREEIVQDNVKSRTVWKAETYQYLGITINEKET